ncbi:P-loop NTPase fold protein [Acaryochloris marina]|uniref:P-loop NTPase fold protein n=1 Tax=Acaryochloris marina TaxID=155978 RepID=UPI001BAE8C5E|nr:P-loop NTPase fold protein [Acaryochloris marina]
MEGFPKRIRDRITYWQRQQGALESTEAESHSPQTPLGIDENLQFGEIARVNQALRQGGPLWEVLYEINEADADVLLEQRLSKEDRAKWNNLKSNQEISNVLWSTLDKIQRQKNQNFQALEQKLKEAEKTLERKQKSNKISINQKLNQRKIRALWTPFFNGIARLKFSKEDIEAYSAAGTSFQKFRDTIKSWQGLLALFCMGLLIALTASSESREAITQLLQTILNSQALRNLIPEWIKNSLNSLVSWLPKAIQAFPTWLQIGSATLISLLPVIKALTTYIGSVQKEQARIQGEKETLIQQSQDRVTSEAQEVAQLRLRVEEERQQLGPNAQYPSLLDFVNARISGDDYGKHLGLMQQIKQDLAALSSRLTLNQSNEQDIQQLFPRGPARVFLYIDDLDRCPPDRVVEVLEAVQLLLNTKLFVVILAIDDRYIARALEQVYAGVLKRRGKPSGIDYLEKIIQIPYRLRPISPDTVERYFRSQLTIKKEDQSCDKGTAQQTISHLSTKPSGHSHSELNQLESQYVQDTVNSESEKLQPTTDKVDNPSNQNGESITQNLTSSTKSSEENLPSPKPSESYAKAAVSPSTEQAERLKASVNEPETNTSSNESNAEPLNKPPTPEEVTYISTIATVDAFDEEELKLLVDCCKYVDITPRTGKRLINIYKILQIIWKKRHKEKDHDLPSDQTKRIVMSFLALSGRYPDFMRNLFDEIDMLLEKETFASTNGEILINPSIHLSLSETLETLAPTSDSKNSQDFHTKREWDRFTSDIKRMVADSYTTTADPVLTLDRRTFSLMLSFCFVGDLGYDPDDHPVNVPTLQNPE